MKQQQQCNRPFFHISLVPTLSINWHSLLIPFLKYSLSLISMTQQSPISSDFSPIYFVDSLFSISEILGFIMSNTIPFSLSHSLSSLSPLRILPPVGKCLVKYISPLYFPDLCHHHSKYLLVFPIPVNDTNMVPGGTILMYNTLSSL